MGKDAAELHASHGSRVASAVKATSFRLDFATRQMESLISVAEATGTIQSDLVLFSSCVLIFNAQRLEAGIASILNATSPQLVGVEVSCVLSGSSAWVFVRCQGSDGYPVCFGQRLHITKFARSLSIQFAEAVRFGVHGSFCHFDVIRAIKSLFQSELSWAGPRILLEEVSLSIEGLFDLSLQALYGSTSSYRNDYSVSDAVTLSLHQLAGADPVHLDLAINHATFDMKLFEKKYAALADPAIDDITLRSQREALNAELKTENRNVNVLKYATFLGLHLPQRILVDVGAARDTCLWLRSVYATTKEGDAHTAESRLETLEYLIHAFEEAGLKIDEVPVLHDSVALAFSQAWEEVDPSKALLAMLKIAQVSDLNTALTQRVTNLISALRERSEREQWLSKFSVVTKNSYASAQLKLFLARVIGEDDQERSRQLTRQSLQHHETDVGMVLYAADNFIYLRFWQDAFGLLSRAAEALNLTDHQRPLVFLKLAEVYLVGFSNTEMALELLQKVRKALPNDLHALRMMQHIYRDLGQSEGLASTLDDEIKILTADGEEKSAIKRLSAELSALYTNDLNDIGKAFALYLSSPGLVEIDPEALLHSMSVDKAKVDWRKLYTDLLNTFGMLEQSEQRAKLHVCLALICRDRLGRAKEAVKHLIDAVHVGWIDPLSFNYLKETLAKERRHDELSEVLLTRIERSKGDKRFDLIKELLSLPMKLADKLADAFALEILLARDDEKELVKRLDTYVASENFSRMDDLMESIYRANCAQGSKVMLIDVLIESLRPLTNAKRFKVLENAYRRKIDFGDDVVATAQEAMTHLTEAREASLLVVFASVLVDQRVIPAVTDETAEALFEHDSKRLAQFYELRALGTPEKQQAAALMQKAITYYDADDTSKAEVERCLLRLCVLQVLSVEAIDRLQRLSKKSKRWQDLADAFEEQIKQVQDREVLSRLYEDLIEVYKTHLNNPPAVIRLSRAALECSDDRRQARYELILYLIDESLADEELQELKSFLADEQCVKDPVKASVVIDRLTSTYQETEFVDDQLTFWIKSFKGKSDFDSAGNLADMRILRGFSDPDLLLVSFAGAVARSDEALSVERLVNLFNALSEVEDLQRYLESVRSLLKITSSELSFDDFMASVGYRFGELNGPESVRFELLSVIIAATCKQDEHSKQAMHLLSLVPEHVIVADQRLWIPVYLLLRDFGEAKALALHLRGIVPLLKSNPKPIRSYPFTVQSLEAELARLAEDVPGLTQPSATSIPEAKKLAPIVINSEGHTKSFIKPGEETRERSFGGPPAQVGSLAKEWRGLAAINNVTPRQALQLCQERFDSQLEKHVAMQVFALLSREVGILSDWPWKVWRYPEQLGYPFDGRERYPADYTSKGLYSKLHRFLIGISKNLVAYYRPKFKSSSLLKDLKLSDEQFKNRLRRIEWDSFIVRSGNLIHIVDVLKQRRIQLFDLRGLKARIFFAGQSRSLYIDTEHYKTQPQSHLFHRLYGVLWAAKLSYLPILQLDPEKEVLPFLQRLKALNDPQPMAKAKSVIKSALDQREAMLNDMMTDDLRLQLNALGEIKLEALQQLNSEMNRHIHRLLLAETLDLFGLCEAITDKDLLIEEFDPKELLASSEDVKRLVDFAMLLKLR